MLDFVLTQTGISATSGTSPVTLTQVILCNSNKTAIGSPITEFTGNVQKDELGIDDNIVVDLSTTLPSSNNDSVSYIQLAGSVSGTDQVIAESEPVSIVATAGKQLKLRITARLYTAAEAPRENRSAKCAFTCTTIGLPYATKNRQGVVRLANPDMSASGDTHKDYTVFTAQDTISKIEEYIHGADQYVPWDESSPDHPIAGSLTVEDLHIVDDYDSPTSGYTTTITATANGLSIDKYLTGNVVKSAPTISSGAISNPTNAVVNENYIASLYSNSIASPDSGAGSTKLVTSHAVKDYIDGTNNDFVHKSGAETITGAKTFSNQTTFSNSIVTTGSALITGVAVQSQYDDGSSPDPEVIWNAPSNYSKLPTVEVVDKAIDAIEASASQDIADLQSQIDALNAGQNLADIVALPADLTSHSITNLQPGDGQSVVGDKIQVLHDPDATGNSTVYELRTGSATGQHDLPSSASTQQNPVYWHYIGEYGNDAYSKSDADSIFFRKDHVKTTADSSDDHVPSTKLMYTELGKYVKLTSASTQTIASPLIIKQGTSATATLSIPDGQHLTANNTFTILADGTHDVASEYNVTNGTFTVNIDSTAALKLATATVSNNTVADVQGSMVASYRDVSAGTLNNGKLVTVDYLEAHTGTMANYARRDDSNTFVSGKTNTFNGTVTLNGTVNGDSVYQTYAANTWNTASTSADLATVGTVNDAIEAKVSDLTDDVLVHASDVNAVGSIGLFIYSEVGNELTYGSLIDGQYLKAVGMSLPMSGQISYKSAALVPSCTGTWKLLSLAVKRTATEPCLVMAQKVHASYPMP